MKYTKTVRASRNIKSTRRPVRASASRRIRANDEIDAPEMEDMPMPEGGAAEVSVDEEASTLLFEAEDVAELVSEISGQPVDVTVDENEVSFAVGEEVYTVTPEGDEEIVEESTRLRKGARRVSASRRPAPARRVAASHRPAQARRVSASRNVARRPATRRPSVRR